MKGKIAICLVFATALAVVLLPIAGRSAVTKLPGEDGTKPALSPAPFPDRMSAYVWRNWGLVDKALLAETVGAKPEDLTAVAEQMGLDPDPVVLPEWKRRGYITIIRRNWHLLPYDQILKLIGKTRDELYFCLMEDDFLWVKLGSVKPKCERLEWRGGMVEGWRGARKRLAAILKEEGLDPRAPEEPRFQFVKDISAVDPGFRMPEKDDSPYDFRLIFSYFANYADPLGDPEIGSFPEGLLQKLAAEGVNAVWLHTVLRTLVKDPKYPEFGEGCENCLANLQKLVDRCRKYGIRVFLYMNEPRGLHPDFFKAPGREKLGGATADGLQAMCTLNPETQRWLSDSLEKVFSTVHGLGGIFTITASENLTNCATRPGFKETCPVCRSHTRGEIIATANAAMIRGMRKGDPNAEAILYDWAWPEEEKSDIVARLPKEGCRLMAVSEHAKPICRGGVNEKESDYSISVVGPGESARRLWGLARQNGISAVAKVQAGNSWEISSFPYIPTMDLVAEHACNIANEGVNGVMLSWSLGCCPSPNLSVYRELRRGETDKEGVLDRLAKRLYGEKAAEARKAWTAFSDGFANYPFSCQTIYVGPHHWGPANPLYARKTGYKATMVGIPYDDLDGWRCRYPGETYAELIGKVADGFAEGCRLMEGVAEKKELDMFRAEQMQFASCRDQALFVMARDCGDTEGIRKYAKAELERAKAYWPIVRADSRIGFESSNQYYYVPRDLLEKVLSCRMILDRPADGVPGCSAACIECGSGRIPMPDADEIGLEGDYSGHLQDVWYDGFGHIYWAHTRDLVKTDLAGRILKRVEVNGHHAGIEVRNGRVYVAVCAMQNTTGGKTLPGSRVTIGEYDAETLDLIGMHVTGIHDRSGSLTILDDGTFLVGCLRPQDIRPDQVRFHHLDRDYRLIRSYVLDNVPVKLGIEVIKRWGEGFILCLYGADANGRKLDFDSIWIDRDFREIRRGKFGGACGLIRDGETDWLGKSQRDKTSGRFTSRLLRREKR